MASQPSQMTLGVQDYDRNAPLLDGSVSMDSVRVVEIPGSFESIIAAWNAVLTGKLDAVEIPVAGHVLWKDMGHPVTGVPVFPDRLFLQQYVYVRRDSDVRTLADLRGRQVCIPQYNMSSSFWHRATLQEDYRISPEEIEWTTLMPEVWPTPHPEGVKVELRRPASGRYSGVDLLVDGEVDCVMHEGMPKMTREQLQKVRCIHEDVHALQRDYYRRTGYHVPTHVVIVREEALQRRPEFGEVICEGFDRAKALAYQVLQDERRTSLPLMRVYIDETLDLFGDDPWCDGFSANRPVLDKFLELAFDQGLTGRRFTPEELFDERSRFYEFKARMGEGAL